MGRATSGVIGMRFTDGDELLDMHVVREGADVLVATGGGYAKRTPSDQYPVQGRGGRGVLTARIVDSRGELVGALMVHPDDEVFAITSSGGVIRTPADEVKLSGRQTMGVRLMNLASGDSVVAIARNAESLAESEAEGRADLSPRPRLRPGPGNPGGAGDPGRGDAETGPGSAAPGPPGMIPGCPGKDPGTGLDRTQGHGAMTDGLLEATWGGLVTSNEYPLRRRSRAPSGDVPSIRG